MARTSISTLTLTVNQVECMACVCYIILITVDIPILKYIFVTIALACSICIYPIVWPERIRAAHGTTAAGLAIGLTNVSSPSFPNTNRAKVRETQASAQLQGIVGPQVYQPKFGPDYKVSFCCSIGLLVGAIASISVTWFLVAKRDRAKGIAAEGNDSLSHIEGTMDDVKSGTNEPMPRNSVGQSW